MHHFRPLLAALLVAAILFPAAEAFTQTAYRYKVDLTQVQNDRLLADGPLMYAAPDTAWLQH